MDGFCGRLLHLDLSSGRSVYHQIEESRLRACLGGIGLGTSLLYDYAPGGIDPLSPANPLIFTSAPLVGTGLTTTAKFAVVTKSPLTGFIADSLSSSLAISTAGASPALAKRMKREIAETYGEPYARLAVILNDHRGWAKGTLPTYKDRKEFFEGIVNGDPDPVELIKQGREGEVQRLIERYKERFSAALPT